VKCGLGWAGLIRAQAYEISSPGPQPYQAQAYLKPGLRPRLSIEK